MKHLRFIFLFVFLGSMVFTVIQYLPLLEEETKGHTEMTAKKACEDSGADGDDSDDDDTKDEKNDLFYHQSLAYLNTLMGSRDFYSRHISYLHPVEKINTPPPKI